MSIERGTLELRPEHVDTRTWKASRSFLRELDARVARNGRVEVPGFALIPDTRSVLGSRANLTRFIDNTTRQLVSYWKKHNPDAIRHVDYLAGTGPRVDGYYAKARIKAHPTELIGVQNTTFKLHTDHLRLHYSVISWGTWRNVKGGTVRLYDALRLRADRGIALEDLVRFHCKAEGTWGWPDLNEYQIYCMAKMDLIDRHPEYMMRVNIDSRRMPLLFVSNKYFVDGMMHGPTAIRKLDPSKGVRRPTYLGSIAAELLTPRQMSSL